jgi:glycosyltransferase involved in cell wall biosynthesis
LLKIAAKVETTDADYYKQEIEPLLAEGGVEFLGEIGEADKSDFLGNASALLFPIDWPEPFGLAMIEAMACGTPVIAWDCGSVPEVVNHGVTGFMVHSEDEAVRALRYLASIERARVRKVFEERFSARTMASRYLRLYARLLSGAMRARPRMPTPLQLDGFASSA